jgi:hypothetical protein
VTNGVATGLRCSEYVERVTSWSGFGDAHENAPQRTARIAMTRPVCIRLALRPLVASMARMPAAAARVAGDLRARFLAHPLRAPLKEERGCVATWLYGMS